jgi:hypothetical protein
MRSGAGASRPDPRRPGRHVRQPAEGRIGREVPPGPSLDFTAGLGDFADTAALVANLHLVVAADMSVAYRAAATGRPARLQSRIDAGWRRLDGRSDSPSYPGLRIFRQPRHGEWDDALAQVAHALGTWAGRVAASRR